MIQQLDITCGEHKHWLCISHINYKTYADKIEVTTTITDASAGVMKVCKTDRRFIKINFNNITLPHTYTLVIDDLTLQEEIVAYYDFIKEMLRNEGVDEIKIPIDYILCIPAIYTDT